MTVPVLRTERLVLRGLERADTDALVKMFADPEMSRFFAAQLSDRAQVEAMVERKLAHDGPEGTGQWVIELDGEVVGIAHLGRSAELPGDLVEMGYSVDRAYGGKGLATEAAAAVLDHGLSTVGLPAVWVLIHESNVVSLKLAQRLGFMDVGGGVHYGDPHRVQVALPGAHGRPHHIELWVSDLARAEESFGWLLGALGWHEFQRWSAGVSWKLGTGYLVVEQSPAVSGEHDRMRPGLNHLALHVGSREQVDKLATEALQHGWRPMFADRYPFAGGDKHYAAYLENADGFEIELVAEPQREQPVTR
jgi:RimJ/RimL family protein N-acetyltransferase/catechol 2,3-dioxygenase-like lactoylglutathione lyase family enzyme